MSRKRARLREITREHAEQQKLARERGGLRSAVRLPEPDGDTPADAVEGLIRRSQRSRQRGEERRALVLLRDACKRDEWRARSWTLLGALLVEQGREDEAIEAFDHAHWLRLRAGEDARIVVAPAIDDSIKRRQRRAQRHWDDRRGEREWSRCPHPCAPGHLKALPDPARTT